MYIEGFDRFQFHFEPRNGWMNDPNGLIYFQGKYHVFFQYYPHAPRWGPMHWGHAVSDDLIHWEELPIALFPNMEYENDGGCFSGSAIVKDGRLYLFYTSVSRELGQTQSVAYSDDGLYFTKYSGNPVILENPLGFRDFCDPKVTYMDDTYYMVVGSGDEYSGKVLLFNSNDLFHWAYVGVLFAGNAYAHCIDRPEWCVDFYAPQTFSDGNRRIMIGWMYHWGKEARKGVPMPERSRFPEKFVLWMGIFIIFPYGSRDLF